MSRPLQHHHPLLSLLLLPFFLPLSLSTSSVEPPGNEILLGFWSNPFEAGTSPAPADVNAALGQNASIFQMSQYIPLATVNESTGIGGAIRSDLIDATNTDAAVFLTVYPFNGFDAVAQSDLDLLASQVAALKVPLNRTVFLRYAPEMQGGGWNVYGNQPTAFIAQWKQMYSTVKAKCFDCQLVWSPNTGQGYPWGQSFPTGANAAADEAALDTNHDGQLDAGDDAYSPYWPGAAYVDWAGMSLYYDISNDPEAGGYCANVLDGYDPLTSSAITPFYQTYCDESGATPANACMISECATGFHTGGGQSAGVGEVALKQAWIEDCITNTTFLDSHPRVKAITQFEFVKAENYETGVSDHRWTNNTAVLAAVKTLLNGFGERIAWAGANTSTSAPSSSASSNSSSGGSGSTGSSSSGSGGDTKTSTAQGRIAIACGAVLLGIVAGGMALL